MFSNQKNAKRAILICRYVVWVTMPLTPCAAQSTDEGPIESREAIEARLRTFEYGETFLRLKAPTDFMCVSFEMLPDVIKSQMHNRLGAVLQECARPQKIEGWNDPGRMAVRVHVAQGRETDDLVEYRWDYLGQSLRAVAGRSALRLEIDLDEANGNPQLQANNNTSELSRVRTFVERVVRLRGEAFAIDRQQFDIQIPWPERLSDGVRFSTNTEQSILAVDAVRWYKRVDFSIRHRTLAIMFYFKPEHLAFPLDGSAWFSSDFREEVSRLAREQSQGAEPATSHAPQK